MAIQPKESEVFHRKWFLVELMYIHQPWLHVGFALLLQHAAIHCNELCDSNYHTAPSIVGNPVVDPLNPFPGGKKKKVLTLWSVFVNDQ